MAQQNSDDNNSIKDKQETKEDNEDIKQMKD